MAEEDDKGKGKDADDGGGEDQHDQGGNGQGGHGDPEIENRAALYGWVPKEQFKGDPKKWVSAEQYVQRADDILPISRAMNRKLEGELTTAKGKIEQMEKTVKAVIQAHKKNADGTYAGRVAQIKKDQVAAVAVGDTETWARLEEEKEKLSKPEEIPFEGGTGGGGTTGPNPVVVQWRKDNSWYDNDPELGTYADSVSNFISARTPNLPPDEFLNRVKDEVKKRFPEKFGNQRRSQPSSVDRSNYGGGDGGGGGKKIYSDLPADAKAACDDLVKQKVLTREKYVKTYFEEA